MRAITVAHPEQPALHGDLPEVGVLHPAQSPEGLELRVARDVGRGVDRCDGRLRLLELRHDLVAGVAGHPAADRLVELVGVLGPLAAGREPRLLDQIRPPHQLHHPFGDALRAG